MKTSWCGMGRPGEKLGSSVRVGRIPSGRPWVSGEIHNRSVGV